ncbi:MAG: HAMP domain-containing protein [Deltaproteobacteria bacterium]|nr:HAMP domain-containing protein [Deltaproteobacteria bacterium]
MRTLYLRIFLAFWAAMLLTGATVFVMALRTESWHAEMSARERYLRQIGRDLIWVYESRGEAGLVGTVGSLEEKNTLRLYLFHGSDPVVPGHQVPSSLLQLAGQAASTGEVHRRFTPRSRWFALPVGPGYVLVAGLHSPTQLQRLLSPRRLGLRVLVTLFFASILCFLLARSLTAPIRTLQAATHRFAGGDFGTRVSPSLGGRSDEIGDLGRDFDVMAERIQGLMEGQRRLLRDVSHELRSPLARLGVALELARQRCGLGTEEPLDRIELEGARLNALFGQLLTLAALESGADVPERGPVDLKALVEDIAEDADFEAAPSHRRVRLSCPEPLVADGSEPLLRQAIENVVRNALRYTGEGTAVDLGLERRDAASGTAAVVSVRDYGPGVPESALARLFEPFYRVAEARDRQSGGHGIGLAIAERAIRLHGGDIRAANAPGGGLLVEITLPAKQET